MPIIDRHAAQGDAADLSAKSIQVITPNNAVDLAFVTKAIYCATAGNVALIAQEDTASVTLPVLAGQVLPVRAKRVLATGTTATVYAMY